MDIDVNRLILAVKQRPAIWDVRIAAYGNRIHKMKQWDEIVCMFCDEDESRKVKLQIEKTLQLKWRSLRDAFVKSYKTKAKSESDDPLARSKKQYIHYNKLLFLAPVIGHTCRETPNKRANCDVSSDNDADSSYSEEWLEDSEIVSPEPKKNKKSENNDSELIQRNSKLAQNTEDEADCDRQFMLSLVSDFKRVPPKLKPLVKINILKCIVEAQNQDYDVQQIPMKFETDD